MNFKQSSKNEDMETSTKVFTLVCIFFIGVRNVASSWNTLQTRTQTATPGDAEEAHCCLWKPKGNKTLEIRKGEAASLVLIVKCMIEQECIQFTSVTVTLTST